MPQILGGDFGEEVLPDKKPNYPSYRDPWGWYVYLHIWLIFMPNVGK